MAGQYDYHRALMLASTVQWNGQAVRVTPELSLLVNTAKLALMYDGPFEPLKESVEIPINGELTTFRRGDIDDLVLRILDAARLMQQVHDAKRRGDAPPSELIE